jgi:chromosome segregation ATPase
MEKSVTDLSGDIESERSRIAEEINASYEEKIEKLTTEHDAKKREVLEKIKVKFNGKLQSAIKEHESTQVSLKETMAKQTNDLRNHFESEVNELKEELEGTKAKTECEKVALEEELSVCNEKIVSVQGEKDALQSQLSSQMTSAASLTNRLDAAKKDLENSVSNSEATTSSLLAEQEKMSLEQKELNDKISTQQQELATKNNKLEELSGKMAAFQDSLSTMSTDKKTIEMKLEAATKQVAKLDATEFELEKSREELNRFKLESSQNSAMLSRLKAEQEAIEKTHGQRTALVGMLETQLLELNEKNSDTLAKLEAAIYDLGQKDDDLSTAREDVERFSKDLADARAQIEATKRAALEQKSQSLGDKDMLKKAQMAESLQREVLTLQQQMAKKSSAAQRLLQQREADCQELKKRIKSLQQDLDKGSLSDRRIFELAAQQSNRESVASSEIDIRNQMVHHLTDKLQENDSELASTEYAKKLIESQVEELCRIHRREDINLDYLKSTIVQFLSKPPGSSERGALLPVIATLLQFGSEDYKLIEQGKTKVTWFGSVLPTMISAPVPETIARPGSNGDAVPLLPSSSAEITISSQPPKKTTDRTSGTSLQF